MKKNFTHIQREEKMNTIPTSHMVTNIAARTLMEGIPLGLALLDENFHILEMNRQLEAFCGYSSNEAWGIHHEFILRTNLPP